MAAWSQAGIADIKNIMVSGGLKGGFLLIRDSFSPRCESQKMAPNNNSLCADGDVEISGVTFHVANGAKS